MPVSAFEEIIENRKVAQGVYAMRVKTLADGVLAGQFYMLRPEHTQILLPRPISVCNCGDGEILFYYQVVGQGTDEFSRLRAGERIQLTGPLGNGFPLELPAKKIALVGGGIGVAPLYYTAQKLGEKGVQVDCYLGFRDEPLLVSEFEACANQVQVATESGAAGTKGFVTQLLDPAKYDAVFCCGPLPMMREVVRMCTESGVPSYISMENRMACGVGACLVCTCTDKTGKNRRSCKDGPVFSGEAIDFDA